MARIDELLEIMARLRDPDGGCPWDLEQDYSTIAPYTIEEAYEVADAIDRRDFDDLRDELGDLLLQVVFHAQMAQEEGRFAFDDIVAAICDKMRRRHPHVFGDATVADADAQTRAWEVHKKRERGAEGPDASALDGISRGMPEWQRAAKLTRRAATVGFDWPDIAPVSRSCTRSSRRCARSSRTNRAIRRVCSTRSATCCSSASTSRATRASIRARRCDTRTPSSSAGSAAWKRSRARRGRRSSR